MKQLAHNRAPLPQLCPLTLALAVGVGVALAPLSAQAGVEIAQQPLLVAKPVPPNIMFILDDSGSMAWEHMPGTTASWYSAPVSGLPQTVSVNDIRLRAANINTMWYNPLLRYDPWFKHDGTSYPNANYDGGNVAADPSGKSGNGTLNFKTKFTQWRTLVTGTDTYGVGNRETMNTGTGLVSSNYQWRYSGFYHLTGSNAGTVTNYKRYDFIYGCASGTSCTNAEKAWRAREVTLKTNGTDHSNVQLSEFDWTPYGGVKRSVTEEIQNYANWFSYYRLRVTMAKAAASKVFAGLGSGYRIGYNTIWNRQNYKIPVGTNDGLFSGVNKQNWFQKLFDSISSSGTPLHDALKRTGDYYSESTSSGPYGPDTGSAQISCRQNFAILTTDGYWNTKPSGSGGLLSNNDNTPGEELTDGKGQTYKYTPERPFMDGHTGTLADAAMYYWKRDLRSDMLNNVPTTAKNPAFWQHMRTFGISIGEQGTLTPNQGTLDKIKAGEILWPTPGNDKRENIDDLWHAAVNSRGEFVAATSPDKFAEALTSTLNAIASETKYEASGGASSVEVKAGAKTFFSRYTSGTWDGDIVAFSINETTGLQDPSPVWDAESQLPTWNSRNIYVNVDGIAQEFLYSKLSSAQKAYLNSDLVDYLRGDRSKEEDKPGGTLRQRAGVLPAFINSQLVYVAATEHGNYYGKFSFASAIAYAAYVTAQQNRRPVIYIAGNNGMLHAFDADSGEEIYAFLPNSSISNKLSNYADKEYGSGETGLKPHQYILDGELTVADAYLGGTWKTILVATQGRGGSGIFALDITNPDDIKFLWEKSATDHDALGNNLGKPVITQIAEGKWRVILGNGPNSNGDRAQLLMFDLATGAFTPVNTGMGGNNGLAAVNSWDSDGDGFHDSAYAGDLRGNVWRFRNLATSPTATILFAGGTDHPITAAPLVLLNQKTGATWVYVGTGQYLNPADLQNTNTQTWYGLIDDGTTITSEGKLMQRKLTASGPSSGGGVGRILESGTEWEIITAGKRGWYINFDLPGNNGERMMTPNFILGGALFGITFTPEVTDPCQPDGSSSIWAINPFSGGRIDQGIFGSTGADGIFNFFTIDGVFLSVQDGLPAITSGAPPIGISTDGAYVRPGPGVDKQISIPKGAVGRQSWREISGQ